ncbi:cell division ATP-binding protein FtsE [Romeriopsis navalis]|nr:cell division ATP-binding protein FtsE [Romeriopsis navalis]
MVQSLLPKLKFQKPVRRPSQAATTAAQPAAVRARHPHFHRPAMTGEGIIQIHNVTKTYRNGSEALVDLNLEIQKGDFLFVTGPSGSGKSTLLKLLYGEEKPNPGQGEVIVDGAPMHRLKGDRLALLRRRLGIVFQDYKLLPRRTVEENIAFVLQAQGYTKTEITRRMPSALKVVGLQHKATCFPSQLSGGEQQRVSIARAIVSTPPILLADEPTGNLDPDNSRQILAILRKLNEAGMTIVVTSHDEAFIRSANRPMVQIRNGQILSGPE